jgi:hypothetical protein
MSSYEQTKMVANRESQAITSLRATKFKKVNALLNILVQS